MKRFALALLALPVCFTVSLRGQGGIITTVAGDGGGNQDGFGGFSGDGGPATQARLNYPTGVAVDSAGNLYIADRDNSRIRKVSPAGTITTIAGTQAPSFNPDGTIFFSGIGGPAASAVLGLPNALVIDGSGNIFIADSGACRIFEISARTGNITTVAGSGPTFLPNADTCGNYTGEGGPATSATFSFPTNIALDSAGNIYVTDGANSNTGGFLRKISAATGIITTVSTPNWGAASLTLDPAGNLFVAGDYYDVVWKLPAGGSATLIAGNPSVPAGFSGDDGIATTALLNSPGGIAADPAGYVYVADTNNNRIREITPNGLITTIAGNGVAGFAGDGAAAASAVLYFPQGLALDSSGNLYFADTWNQRIRKISAPVAGTAPIVENGGVVPIYSSVNTVQPGEWVSIYGARLASSTQLWNGDFPESLGVTSVTIDGNPAYLWFVSPYQINLQVPDDTRTGTVPVVVNTPGGSFSSTVTLAPSAPSFSLLDSKHVIGIILRFDGSGAYGGGVYDIIGPTGNSLGYPTVAARAGDSIELFAVGLGPTNPAVPAGKAFSGSAPTNSPVNLVINGTTLSPSYAGLTSAGLYQINLTVPSGLGSGDVPIQATVGGVSTQSGVVISLQ
jgi:uncharacterized protein (TIGR03437 family)